MNKAATLLALSACAFMGTAHADVIFNILNADDPGVGFNDTSAPLLPAPGNDTAATLGQQRLTAFQFAADLWSQYLDHNGAGDVTIVVNATFAPSDCTANGGNLGSAGPQQVFRDFANAPQPNVFYPGALADALAGSDLSPGNADIGANFNGDIDRNPNCLGDGGSNSTNWYYGLDAQPPSGTIDFLDTAVHELAHGLGFLTFVNASGAQLGGIPDAYLLNLFDVDQGLAWQDMTNAQRATSMTNTGGLVWTGPQAAQNGIGEFLGGIRDGALRMYAPNPREPGSSVSHWDTALAPNTFMEPFATGDNRVTETFGLEVCAMADIGWPLQAGVQCPDPIDRATATVGNGTPASCTEAALTSAVASGDGRLITFDCGANPVTITLSSPLTFTSGFNELDGGNLVTLSGTTTTRLINNTGSSSRLVLRSIRLVDGFASGSSGGAVFNSGTLSVIGSALENNAAPGFGGAVINNNTGADTLTDQALLANNFAGNEGGAIFNFGGAVHIINSTISGNESNIGGGALFADAQFRDPIIGIRNSTIFDNTSAGTASVLATGGTLEFINSIVGGENNGTACSGGSGSARGNNLDDDGSCSALAGGNFTVGATGLQPLADNGGPTQTHAVASGPAVDGGDAARCGFAPVDGTDQRGVARSGSCEIGAFEIEATDDNDGDEIPDASDPDDDNDGIPDTYEIDNGLDPFVNDANEDADGDGVSNLDEFNGGTRADTVDSDADGLHDGLDAQPATASNLCSGTNATFANQLIQSGTVGQCGASGSVTAAPTVTIEPGATVEIRSPASALDPQFQVPAGAILRIINQDPAVPAPS